MLDKKLDRVFELRSMREQLREKIKVIDATKTPILEELNEVESELEMDEFSVLQAMEEKNIKTYTYGINNVTLAIRRTLGITDEKALMHELENHGSRIAKVIGMKMRDIKANAFLKVLNKPFAKEIADSFLKVEGKTLIGTELKETKYLTIK